MTMDLRFAPRAALEQSNERTTKQFEQLDHRTFSQASNPYRGAEVLRQTSSRDAA
jgi:hypothetical protein